MICRAAPVRADDLDTPAEAVCFVDLTLSNRFEARDFGMGAGRFDKRALQITIIGLHVNGNEGDGNNQQDQSHGSPFNFLVAFDGGRETSGGLKTPAESIVTRIQ